MYFCVLLADLPSSAQRPTPSFRWMLEQPQPADRSDPSTRATGALSLGAVMDFSLRRPRIDDLESVEPDEVLDVAGDRGHLMHQGRRTDERIPEGRRIGNV